MAICSRSGVEQAKRGGTVKKAGVLLLLLVYLGIACAQQQPAQTPAPAAGQGPQTTPPAQIPEESPVTSPVEAEQATQGESQGSAPLRVMVGKSLLINTTERIKRVSVTDPTVADAI